MEGPKIWHLDRNDITFETLIKTGHFANIYKAKLNDKRTRQTVAVKTLKGCINRCSKQWIINPETKDINILTKLPYLT